MLLRLLWVLGALLLLNGCVTSGYKEFYHPYLPDDQIPQEAKLKRGERPQLVQAPADDLVGAIRRLRSKGYMPIGYSAFNGGYEDSEGALAQATRIGATLVLVGSAQHTETRQITTPLFVPNSSTTYSSGTVSAGGVSGIYSGTSTTYGSRVVPITTHQERYDQGAVYFVPLVERGRFGIFVLDLTPEQRRSLERNTGAMVDIVMENTAAFDANVLEGDILLAVDGQNVRNAEHAVNLMRSVSLDQHSSTLRILRKGEEKHINVIFQ